MYTTPKTYILPDSSEEKNKNSDDNREMCMNECVLKEGATYQHYKGGLYQIIKIAYHTEIKTINSPGDIDDSVKMVVYRAIYTNPSLGADVWWVRPYRMFVEEIMVDGMLKPRFTFYHHDQINM